MSHRPADHNIFSDDGPAKVKMPGSDKRPKDNELFGELGASAQMRKGNSAGKNITDSSLQLGGDYPEPPSVTDKVK
ncbi:hypothetical protein KFE25_008050 [Diacronema lutheri]|uniref:Uncharacterized protein n=1 Tax=Diacronema lutheri TaxID=2081491 RepID=A0A8J6CD15_DIALT|nr:hypothetical protein KFE25_008050 [Diacronema lutheri]